MSAHWVQANVMTGRLARASSWNTGADEAGRAKTRDRGTRATSLVGSGVEAGDSGLCAPRSVSRWRRPITSMALQAALLAETRPDLDLDNTTEPG